MVPNTPTIATASQYAQRWYRRWRNWISKARTNAANPPMTATCGATACTE